MGSYGQGAGSGGSNGSRLNGGRSENYGTSSNPIYYAGGGGGFFGGGGGTTTGMGGGGSGYVNTAEWWSLYNSSWTNGSKYFVNDWYMYDGTQRFVSPDGSYETGHEGNGFVRISVLH